MSYLIYSPETPDEEIYQLRFGANTIGRGNDNRIILMHENISRHHAEIKVADDRVTIRDLRSTNGTFVNEVKIDQCELQDGDLIACGDTVFKFVETLKSFRQESPDEAYSEKSILKQISPDQSRIVMQDLLAQDKQQGSILMLRQQNPNQRAVDKLKILLEVSKQLCSPEKPERLLERILDLLFNLMDIDRAVILMVNEESGQLERKTVKLRSGIPADDQFYSTKIINLVRSNGNALLTADARIDKRLNNSESIVGQAIHASMCVPLKPHNEVIGVLYVDNLLMSAVYSDEDLEFLSALANQAAVSIHMAREVYKREQKLKKQVVQLQIQIDQARKERQVSEIVGSDYFKKLAEKAKKLRNEV